MMPFFLFLSVGCTEYAVSEITAEGFAGDDTGEPSPVMEADDCVESSTAFDIEEVSALQDAFGLPRVQDGLALRVDPSVVEGGHTWRPVSVEVLIMYPSWYFNMYDDSNELTVNFFPQESPMGVQPLSKTIQIRKADLEWEDLRLPADADWSGDDRDQVAAWLVFDLSDVVPEEGYQNTEYFVSLGWDSIGYPNVGYSNFELNCPQNWTDYGNGSYVQNTGQDCSWPMLKIEVEVVSPGDCE